MRNPWRGPIEKKLNLARYARARRKASCAESFAAGQKEPFLIYIRGRVKVCQSAGNMDHFADAHTHFPLIAHSPRANWVNSYSCPNGCLYKSQSLMQIRLQFKRSTSAFWANAVFLWWWWWWMQNKGIQNLILSLFYQKNIVLVSFTYKINKRNMYQYSLVIIKITSQNYTFYPHRHRGCFLCIYTKCDWVCRQ